MSDRKKILVIDDDASLLSTLGDFLSFEGFDVSTAISGEAGLELAERIAPDLIILDMSMPGMGGIAVLKRLSEIKGTSGIPVYVFTARANMQEFFQNTNVAGFMAKPCDPNSLLADVRRIAGKGGVNSSAGSPKRVLLAEDEGGRRASLVDAFTKGGLQVVAVGSGPEAVERAVMEKPDVVVMKLVMTNMNGDAAADVMGSIPSTCRIPVILYDDTGSQPRERTAAGKESAVWRFVKSSNPVDIHAAVRTVLSL